MTYTELRNRWRGLLIVVLRNDGEIRLNYRGGKEATAYYTDCPDDAHATAHSMVKQYHAAQHNVHA